MNFALPFIQYFARQQAYLGAIYALPTDDIACNHGYDTTSYWLDKESS
jgi:hypothetical protein